MNFLKQIPRTTLTIIVICSAVCLVINLFPFNGNLTEKAILFGAYYKAMIIAGEYWRILTCGLIHVSFWHLMMNMYSLLNIGIVLERILGWKNYLMTLIISTLTGSLFLFILSGNTVAVGLSGGLYGLMGCEIYILYRKGALRNQAVQRAVLQTILMNLMINSCRSLPGRHIWAEQSADCCAHRSLLPRTGHRRSPDARRCRYCA